MDKIDDDFDKTIYELRFTRREGNAAIRAMAFAISASTDRVGNVALDGLTSRIWDILHGDAPCWPEDEMPGGE